MEQAGRAAREEECRHEWRHGSLEGYATVAWSMEGRGGYVCFNDGSSGRGKWTWRWHGAGGGRHAKSGSGGTRADLGVRPTRTTLLRQGQAGIAVQHMKMALFDEGGVGGGQDIEIID